MGQTHRRDAPGVRIRTLNHCLVIALSSQATELWAEKRSYIEEVVVTAQKRSESIQDVPISVSVLSAERMDVSAITSFEDVALASPNTMINMTPGYIQLGMRGVNAPINDGMEQSVGFYVDGIYYGKTAFLQDAFLDLDRIELLKGPQGTLFGKNTVAGAISVSSANPVMEWTASASASQGELGSEQYEAMVNVPLISERLALRVAATREHRDGFVFNSVRQENEKRVDKRGVRAKLLWEARDDLRLVLSSFRGESNDNGQGWEPFVLADDARQIHGAYDDGLEARFNYQSHANEDNASSADTQTTIFQADWEIGDHLLTLIVNDAQSQESNYLDADTASAPIADWLRLADYEQQMAELRWTSAPGSIEYIIGLFGFWSEADHNGDLTALPDGAIDGFVLNALGVNAFDALVGSDNGAFGDVLVANSSDTLIQHFNLRTRTEALFSQLTWHFNERMSVLLGLRASRETKDVDLTQQYPNGGLLLQAAFGVTQYSLNEKRDESNVAPKLSFKYELGDDLIYASYAHGFKAGGYNPLARNAGESEFDQEMAVAYELGYKLMALDGALTLNTALYRTEFEDMQIQAFIGNGFIVNNAARATTAGAEVDLNYQPARGTQIFASWGYSDARFDSYPDGPCPAGDSRETCDLTGNRLPRAPKYSASLGFNTAIPIMDGGFALVLGGDVNWRDHILFDLDGDPIDAQDEYHLVNLHLGLTDSDGRWRFMLNARNVADRKVRVFAADLPVFSGSHMGFLAPPRVVTASFQYSIP